MQDRRIHPRMLCADLIEVWWTEASGQCTRVVANLEDISSAGVCLQLDTPVAEGILLHILLDRGEFVGRTRYCVFRDTGYFIGVEFEAGFQWDEQLFQPKHLLDPRSLLDPEEKPESPEPLRLRSSSSKIQ